MGTTLVLIAAVLGLLFALELLSAIFDGVVRGLAADASRGKIEVSALTFVPVVFRTLLQLLLAIGQRVSLVMHELAHAIAQLAFGGQPRIVLLSNGGYASAGPWFGLAPMAVVWGIGLSIGRGIMAIAPILLGSALLVATFVITTKLTPGSISLIGHAIGTGDRGWIAGAGAMAWEAFAEARWWTYPVMVSIGMLIAPCMTPSSVDYAHGGPHLAIYAFAAVVCTAVAQHAPAALWMVIPVGAALGVLGLLRGPAWSKIALGGLGLATAALALVLAIARRTGADPVGALHAGLGTILFALAIAAIVYVAFTAMILVLSLFALRPRTLWLAMTSVPGEIANVFRTFDTCDKHKVHYRGTCDVCARESKPASA